MKKTDTCYITPSLTVQTVSIEQGIAASVQATITEIDMIGEDDWGTL